MIQFIKQALSEDNQASSRRIAFYILLFAFLGECFVNIGWRLSMADTLRDQLYYAMLTALGTIFGGNAINAYVEWKKKQAESNAAAGSSTPPVADATK